MAFIDHLEIVTPDYTDVILTKSANFDIPMPGAYKQVINETDGGSRKVVTMKTTPDATINLKFTGVTQAEADTLSDFYYNPLKAYGMARSYIWQHSQTQEFFTVQNISEYNETATIMSYGRYDISFTAKILGFPGLVMTSTGSTIDVEYAGTAIFKTIYSDGTSYTGIDPPLKDFGIAAVRKTVVVADDATLVKQLLLSGNDISKINYVKSYTSLERLFLNLTGLLSIPDLKNNISLSFLYFDHSDVEVTPSIINNQALIRFFGHYSKLTIAPDVTANTSLEYFLLNDCLISQVSLSECVNQLYENRVVLGGNSCVIGIENNNGLTVDAIAKIDGTGLYIGDGLIDAGCTVTY